MSMIARIRAGERLSPHHYTLDEGQWHEMIALAPGWFIAHWCDDLRAYALFLDQETPLVVSTPLIDGRYFALSAALPCASWPERIAQDLWGCLPLGAIDTEPALDRGGWASIAPLSARSVPAPVSADHTPSPSLFAQSVHGDMAPFMWGRGKIMPGAAHVGLMHRLKGCMPEEALRLISRSNGSAFVAAPLAYSRAIENALGIIPDDATRDARTILLEIERIVVHCRDIAQMAQLTGFALLATHASLAEDLCAGLCAHHGASRRLTDMITPQGIAAGVDICGLAHAIHDALMPRLPVIEGLHFQMAETLEGLGTIPPARAQALCLGGLVGRASGRSFDLRQLEDDMRHVPGRAGSRLGGDGWARQCLRLDEIRDSLRRIDRIAANFGVPLPSPAADTSGSGEGIGAVEGPHGDIWCWVRLKESRLDGIMLRDPALATLGSLPALMHDVWEDRLVLASLGFDPAGAEQ